MKIKYVGVKGSIEQQIKRIYRLVLKKGYRIKRIYKRDKWYQDIVVLQMSKDGDEQEVILYPPGRVVTRKGHGEKV